MDLSVLEELRSLTLKHFLKHYLVRTMAMHLTIDSCSNMLIFRKTRATKSKAKLKKRKGRKSSKNNYKGEYSMQMSTAQLKNTNLQQQMAWEPCNNRPLLLYKEYIESIYIHIYALHIYLVIF